MVENLFTSGSQLVESIRQRFTPKDWLLVASLLLGISCVIGGFLLIWYRPSPSLAEVTVDEPEVSLPVQELPSQIQVAVTGAVSAPGIYSLSSSSRVAEAITAAGGFSPEADQEFVNRELNIAEQLQDEAKIYIPFIGQSLPAVVPSVQATGEPRAESAVSLNHASQAELEALPGIGSSRATEIMENRPFMSIEELVSKKIISAGLWETLKNQIAI